MPEPRQQETAAGPDEAVEWRLEGALGLAEAEWLRGKAVEMADRACDVIVDLSGVEHVGGGCAQVLLALSRRRAACGRRLELRGVRAGVSALLEATGFEVLLAQPATAGAAEVKAD